MTREHGGRQTYYVVQSFSCHRKGYVMDEPVQAHSQESALRAARRLAETKQVVLAFSRTGDPATGDFDDAVIIFSKGEIPEELSQSLCA